MADNNNRCGNGYLYGPQTLELPRGEDGPKPNHEPKRSSAPWPTQPDRGPTFVYIEHTPKGRRGRR